MHFECPVSLLRKAYCASEMNQLFWRCSGSSTDTHCNLARKQIQFCVVATGNARRHEGSFFHVYPEVKINVILGDTTSAYKQKKQQQGHFGVSAKLGVDGLRGDLVSWAERI